MFFYRDTKVKKRHESCKKKTQMINDTKAVLTVSRNWLVVPGIVVYL